MSEEVAQQEAPNPELLQVEDLDHFIALLTDWHNRQAAIVAHLQQVPQGVTMLLEQGEGEEPQERTMEGDFLDGFRIGLGMALNYLGKLPFLAEYQDVPPVTH